MYAQMNGERTPLDKGFLTSLKSARERPFVGMDALVPGEIRTTAKSLQLTTNAYKIYFCTALPTARERADFLLTIRVLQIDELKNVHSIVGW
jgi:hypothetical protein